jgi:hypothetical protein
VYGCVIILFIAGVVQTHLNRKQAISDNRQAANDRLSLNKSEAANEARLTDANANLQKLQDKVDHLQTQADTKEMSRALSDVTKELEDAKTKLQRPLARFAATIATPYYDKMPITETVGERTPEGIRASFGVFNLSSVTAEKGEIIIRLCDGCQYGVEPEGGFTKTKNGPDDERVREFDRVQEHSVVQDMAVTIIPPFTAGSQKLVFAVLVKCENCEPGTFKRLFVDIPSVVPPDFTVKKKKAKNKL